MLKRVLMFVIFVFYINKSCIFANAFRSVWGSPPLSCNGINGMIGRLPVSAT